MVAQKNARDIKVMSCDIILNYRNLRYTQNKLIHSSWKYQCFKLNQEISISFIGIMII